MLVNCPDCGHKVSDKAAACPNCGCPMEEIMKQLYLFSRPVENWAKVSYLSKCRTLCSPGEIAPVLIAWNAVK